MPLSPLTVTFVQSTFLNALSNFLAQLIDQRNSTVSDSDSRQKRISPTNKIQKPFALNTLALLQFVTYGILIVPINFYWQRALEARYPGFPSRAEIGNVFRCSSRSCSLKSVFSLSAILSSLPFSSDRDALPSHKDKGKEKWAPRAKRSGLHSFVMKFIFDQTVAGVMNIVLFVVLINFLKGESSMRLWELVLLVCFSYLASVPTQILTPSPGFPSYHDCQAEVQTCCFHAHVHCHSGGSPSCLWKRLWCYLGHLP